MEDIKLAILNHSWEQAVKLTANSNYLFTDVMESIMEDEFLSTTDALRLMKMAFMYGFLQEHFDYDQYPELRE